MAQTISKTGGATVELGTWVDAQNNAEYTALMTEHSATIAAGNPVQSPAFNAMVEAFLAATNQEIVL
jgi:hypothetical protein